MAEMLGKRLSTTICGVLFLLVSVNKAYYDRHLSTEVWNALLASIAEGERPTHNGDETLLRLELAAKTEKDHQVSKGMVASSSGPPAGAAPGVTPSTFSAFGDARQIANGCNATASSRSVTCPSSTFVASARGKDIWFTRAGPSGAAFGTIISEVSGSKAITIGAAPPTSVTQTRTVYGCSYLT
jgi:hypothetical protein